MNAAAAPQINKTVSYRRCTISPAPTHTLQQLVEQAIAQIPIPGNRLEPLNAASTELRVIGHTYAYKNCLCGYLTTFERGAGQPVVEDDPSAVSLSIGSAVPPKAIKGKPQEQYIPGIVYFVLFQNHVVLVQSSTLRASALEAHLNWLLKSKTSLLPATSMFALSDEAQKATKAKIKKSHVKSIAFGQPLMEPVSPPKLPPLPALQSNSGAQVVSTIGASATPKKKDQLQYRPAGPMLDMLRSVFENEADFQRLGLDKIFDGNLEIWIEVRYPKFSRSRPEQAVELMDTLGVALRDLEGDHVSLKLANGHTVSGSELKISGTVLANQRQDKLPEHTSLFHAMVEWLKAQIASGVVDP